MYSAELVDVTIDYDRMGCGEPLVFIHGFGERKEGWACQHALSDAHDLIIPELRGHGRSTHDGEVSIEAFARDILGLLDAIGVESAHICGLSMGGVVAQELYRMAPERCRSLILVSTFYSVPRFWRVFLYQMWMWRTNYLPPAWRQMMAVSNCLVDCNKETLQRFHSAMSPNTRTYQQTLEACLHVDNSDLLPKIQVPTLVVGSECDLLTPLWIQVQIHRLIKGSELAVLPRAGHMAKLEQPEEFNRVIRQFLAKQQQVEESA